MNNALKMTYILSSTLMNIYLMAIALFSPIYITPGFYWWTSLTLFLFFMNSYSYSNRLNSWDEMGKT